MFNLQETDIEYQHFNERDIEVPILLKSLELQLPRIQSMLDVGAWYSHHSYASQLRQILGSKKYDGVDIQDCDTTKKILDNYYVGNVCDVTLSHYDSVICISTIEHSGISTYLSDMSFRHEQNCVFSRIDSLAQKYILLSCPFGEDDIYPNQYANITNDQLSLWEEHCLQGELCKIDIQFWFNEFPQGREKWHRITREEASVVPLRPERGAQCICFFEVNKRR